MPLYCLRFYLYFYCRQPRAVLGVLGPLAPRPPRKGRVPSGWITWIQLPPDLHGSRHDPVRSVSGDVAILRVVAGSAPESKRMKD